MTEEAYNGPKCKKCSKEQGESIFYIPSFLLTEPALGIVKGKVDTIFRGMTPVWGCLTCGERKEVTVEDGDFWMMFWADMFFQVFRLMRGDGDVDVSMPSPFTIKGFGNN